MRSFLAAVGLFAVSVSLSLPAKAQSIVVVELYTSQGCSSCPPADDLLSEVSVREDVLALGLHVDYWDYLGWEDDLAQPEFTKRQALFNTNMKSRYRLVTPQMIFQGRDYVAGAKRAKALEYIDMLAAEPEKAELTLTRNGTEIVISVRPRAGASIPGDLHVVRYMPEVSRDILRGENADRKIVYTNTVMAWDTVAEWDGTSELRASYTASAEGEFAVILQAKNIGPVLAARKVK